MQSPRRNNLHVYHLVCFILVFALSGSINALHAQVRFPVHVSSNKRHLVDESGKPFPILGRTAWFVLSQPEPNYRAFIANTIKHGHNAIEMAVITHWPTGNHAPFNGEGELPFLKNLEGKAWDGKLSTDSLPRVAPDFTTPNEKYWRFVDRFLDYCDTQGILVFLFPAYVGYAGGEQGWMKDMIANGPAKVKAYGQWIASRYKAQKNIVWMLLGDMGTFDEPQRMAEQALIDGLKLVPGQRSRQYTAESHSGENAADNSQFGKEMTLNGVYTWELKVPVPFLSRKGYAHQPALPAFLLEEPYDEEGDDGNNYNPNATQPVRRFQWWGWLGTIGGYISGNGYVWPFMDPVWQQHLETQGAQDMSRLNKFITSLEWWKLVPSGLNGMKNIVIDHGNKDTSASYIAAAAATDGSLLVAYIPPAHKGAFTIDRSIVRQPCYTYWFDPSTGKHSLVRKVQSSRSGSLTLEPPGKNGTGQSDWVLLIQQRPIAD